MKDAIKPSLLLVIWASIAGGAVFGLLFGPVWAHPGAYMFSAIEDGLKNYYTVAWYALHDHGLHFTGMNYPWGEHIVFTDNQPLLATLLRRFRTPAPAVSDVIAVVNLLMLLAQVLSVPVLAALLRRCRLPTWYTVLMAVVIALFTPQLDRLLGHYALSYGCVIPGLWYLLVRAFETPRRAAGWWGAYGLLTLVLGWLHPYYLLISALLIGSHLVVGAWQTRPRTPLPRRFWIGGVLALVVPVVLFQGTMVLTDPYAPDRTTEPYGFFEYSTSVWSVFFPVTGAERHYWQAWFHTPDPTWEGQAYVGLVATVVAILTLVRVGRRMRARQWARLRWPALPPLLQMGLWAALLVLLFAMGWPFRWGLQKLVDLLGPLRQFRSIGRFAWVFYYIFSVYAAYVLYQGARWLRQRHRSRQALVLLVGALTLWGAEALYHATQKAYLLRHLTKGAGRTLAAVPHAPGHFLDRLTAGGRRVREFQALLPLPYYTLGSEKIAVFRSDRSGYQSMRASLETGLPIATAMLSRTALWQAEALMQLMSSSAIEKGVLPAFPDRRPLLLVVAAGAHLTTDETALLARARPFYRDSAVWLAELPLTVLDDRDRLVARFDSTQKRLVRYPTYWASAPAPEVVLDNLDAGDEDGSKEEAAALPGLLGAGSRAIKRQEPLLFDGPLPRATTYEASVWAYLRTQGLPALHVRQTDARGHEVDSLLTMEAKNSTDLLGDWVRLTVPVRVQQPGNRLRIWLDGRRFIIDAFCLRPADVEVWQRDAATGLLVWNNYPLPAQPPHPAGWPPAGKP